jgi:hypothetical protein
VGLASRARRLMAARAVELQRGKFPPQWLCYVDVVGSVDVDSLPAGARILSDVCIVRRRALFLPDGSAHPDSMPDEATLRERIASGPDDYGRVYAWNGECIGVVRSGRRGGVLLEFQWPADLATAAPGDGLPPVAPPDLSARVAASRAADGERIAAELAEVELLRRRG